MFLLVFFLLDRAQRSIAFVSVIRIVIIIIIIIIIIIYFLLLIAVIIQLEPLRGTYRGPVGHGIA